MNALVQEIINVINAAGLTPDKASNAQLLAAIQAVANGPAKSFASPGYQKLPSGLILQWGVTGALAGGASAAITLPEPLPNQLLSVTTGWSVGAAGTGSYTAGVGNFTATGFDLFNYSTNTAAFYWNAIGY